MNKTLSIPTLKWGKRKERSQICEIFTEDGRIRDMELDVLHGCVQNKMLESGDAHLLSQDNQFMDEEDGIWKQQIGELSVVPICLIKPKAIADVNERVEKIYADRREAIMTMKNKEALKSPVMDRLMWIITIVCSSAIVIAAIQYFGGS